MVLQKCIQSRLRVEIGGENCLQISGAKKMECPVWAGHEILPQVEEFEGVLTLGITPPPPTASGIFDQSECNRTMRKQGVLPPHGTVGRGSLEHGMVVYA